MGVFDNLKEEFNIEEAESQAKSVISTANEKIEEVKEGIKTQKYTIEDKEFGNAEPVKEASQEAHGNSQQQQQQPRRQQFTVSKRTWKSR